MKNALQYSHVYFTNSLVHFIKTIVLYTNIGTPGAFLQISLPIAQHISCSLKSMNELEFLCEFTSHNEQSL